MSITVASSNLAWPDAQPIRLFSGTGTGTNISFQFAHETFLGTTVLILGFDAVAQGSEPIMCFCQFTAPAGIFLYYDSQSTGQGLGVRFQWRGQSPLFTGEAAEGRGISSGSINWSFSAWGLLVPVEEVGSI